MRLATSRACCNAGYWLRNRLTTPLLCLQRARFTCTNALYPALQSQPLGDVAHYSLIHEMDAVLHRFIELAQLIRALGDR
jgi:hypothetical protein